MGYRGVVPYHGMVWDLDLRSHIIADNVWDSSGISHGMNGIFLEGSLQFIPSNSVCCSGVMFVSHIGSHV